MATPSFISAGSINFTGSGDNTPTPPAHQANDILIIACMNDGNYTMSTSTSGWTEIAEIQASTPHVAWYWKRATGSGTAGATIVPSNSLNDLWAICYVIRGCITTGTPYEDATTDWGNALETTPDTALITTTDVNRLVCCFASMAGDDAWSTPPPPSGWTTGDDSTSADGRHARHTVISIEKATAGDVNATTIGTLSTGRDWGSLTLGFIPAPKKSAGFFAFFCESWQRHDKLWRNNRLHLPKDLGFSY